MTGGAFIYVFIVALLAFVLVTPALAQVHVDIGIHLPVPPQLVVVPEVRAVQYAPTAPANIFFYSGQYWAFANGGWHVSAGYNGPGIVVTPQVVPRTILLVPVNYYRIPPGHWKQWAKHQPPRWGDESGRRSANGKLGATNRKKGTVKVMERATGGAGNQEHACSASRSFPPCSLSASS
jgi:hypothetical protein